MGRSRLDTLYSQLSELRARQRRGASVQSDIDLINAEIDALEKVLSKDTTHSSPSPVTGAQPTINMDVNGNVVGGAFGTNASVNADVIAGTLNQQHFTSTTHRHEHYDSSPSIYQPHPAHTEVIAGNIVANWAIRIYNAAPQAVTAGLATFLPVLLLFSEKTIILGVIGMLTITPLGIYVLSKTSFMRIPREAYRDDKLLYYSSFVITGLGVFSIILFVVGYLLAMTMLSAVMGAVREQIYRN